MQTRWTRPATIPPLADGAVQLWRLELADGVIAASERDLSDEEKARAAQMRVPAVRAEFVAGRALLRRVLGAALGVAPAAVVMAAGPTGKPRVMAASGVDFNVSHSRGLILVAISRAGAVGVDVEFVDRAFAGSGELLEIARESFPAVEFESLRQAGSGREGLLQFFRSWTRKEAVAKADGRGIASGLQYRVSGADGSECRVTVDKGEPGGSEDYFVQTPDVGPNHLAALAMLHAGQPVSLFDASDLPTD